jgi:hypothetical protein
MARLVKVTLWLLVGHGMLAAVYWGLLNVPESNVAMLAASTALVMALLVGAIVVEVGAVLGLGTDAPWTERAWRALAAAPAFVFALAIWFAFAWLHSRLASLHEARSGEIDAWLIARFDWTRTAWLHRAMSLALHFLRDVLGLSLAVGALVTGTLGTLSDLLRLRWTRHAFAWRRLLVITLALVCLIWLPWQASTWRPASLPSNVVQPIFAAAKLAVIAVIAHMGWTLILWSATLSPRRQVER